MLKSDYRELCKVELPYRERQMYMHTFDLSDQSMPVGYEDYLPVVKSLCLSAGAVSGVAHMTVDEKLVTAGMSQRRPKPHVDGCFSPSRMDWGHGGGWNHGCNNLAGLDFKRMPVIVASSIPGCRAWRGEFDAEPASDGDLSTLELNHGEVLPANVGYLLSADCVHESMIQQSNVHRSFLRIALPIDFIF